MLTIFVNSPPFNSKTRENKIGYRIGYLPCVVSLPSTEQSQRKTVSAQEVKTSWDFPALAARTFPLCSLNSFLMTPLMPAHIPWYDEKVRETGPNTCRDLWTDNLLSTPFHARASLCGARRREKWPNNHGEGDDRLLWWTGLEKTKDKDVESLIRKPEEPVS